MSDFLGPLHMVRNDGYPWQLGNKHKDLQLMIKIIAQFLPLIGRIQTKTKTFAGLVTRLKSNNGLVKFTITDCHIDETSSDNARTHVKEVALDDLMEIEPINKSSTDSLWVLYLKQKEKKQ